MDPRDRLILQMAGPVDSDRQMVANARTSRAFSARVVGRFKPLGPNAWDPAEFVAEQGAVIRIFPGVRVQVEAACCWFRMRYRGGVSVFEGMPDVSQALDADPSAQHEAFVAAVMSGFRNARGIGATAFIARSLDP